MPFARTAVRNRIGGGLSGLTANGVQVSVHRNIKPFGGDCVEIASFGSRTIVNLGLPLGVDDAGLALVSQSSGPVVPCGETALGDFWLSQNSRRIELSANLDQAPTTDAKIARWLEPWEGPGAQACSWTCLSYHI
jgi:hypothetical protein